MKILDLENWNRKGHFEFFTQFEEPFFFFGITAPVEVATAYENAKATQTPFFIYYLHKILTAVNAIENFKYRIKDQQIIIHDRIDTSATIMREDKTFGFSHIEFHPDLEIFKNCLKRNCSYSKHNRNNYKRISENIIHFSAIPWLNFTGLTHARSFTWPDSCPKISVGKIFEENSNQKMNVSVTVHHGLMDGYHVSLFFEELQKQLNS